MTVILDGTTLSQVLDWIDDETVSVSVHGWINETTVANNVDANAWNRELKRIILVTRETDANKDAIETSANGMAKVTLAVDLTNYTVWIHRISSTYKANVNWALPWLMEIELIISD